MQRVRGQVACLAAGRARTVSLAACLALVAFGVRPSKAEDAKLARFEFSQVHMGAPFTIILYCPNEAAANGAAEAAFERIAELDRVMSDYNPDSELNRVCKSAGSGKSVAVSPDLWDVLSRSQELAAASDGAFDVTVGPMVRLWRRARRTGELPAESRLAKARSAVGYQNLRLRNSPDDVEPAKADPDAKAEHRYVELLKPDMKLDLGGIGMGYAADQALLLLKERGIDRAMVDASGDIAVGAPPPDSNGWRIGVAPLEAPDGPPSRYLRLSHAAVTTSGDAFQYVEIAGRRYSHIVDPRTGLGLTERSSVTVVASDCTLADGMATAVSVLGHERGIELVERTQGAAALIVRQDGDKLSTVISSRFAAFEDR